ncbi:hypothetical protein WN943_007168 [Citrus x changshan-huyou]
MEFVLEFPHFFFSIWSAGSELPWHAFCFWKKKQRVRRSRKVGECISFTMNDQIRAERNKCSLLNPQKPLNNHQRINKNIAAIIVGHTLRQKDWLTMISPLKKLKFIRITELVTNVGTDKHFKRVILVKQ